jgi:flagellar motor switch protein FliN/FliY
MPDLSLNEIEALRTLLTNLCPNLALSLAEQLNRDLILEPAEIRPVPIQELLARTDSLLSTVFSLSQPVTTESIFLLSEEAARVCADLIAGNEGTDPPLVLTEAQVESLSQAMSGLARGFAVALGNLNGEILDLESCTTTPGALTLPPVFAAEGSAIQARLTLSIPETYDGDLTFLFTPEFVQAIIPDTSDEAGDADNSILSEAELAAMLGNLGGGDLMGATESPASAAGGGFGGSAPAMGGSPFASFPTGETEGSLPRGMELILDIPLDVTVELGRVRMLIKDVLELASGSIVELDRVAGEPVDLLVNGRLIAKGEVVVIEDNFGIRITEIISPADRVTGLGKGR